MFIDSNRKNKYNKQMKRVIFLLILLIVFLNLQLISKDLKIDLFLSKNRLKANNNYNLMVEFSHNKNILVNLYPLIKIKILDSPYLKFPKDELEANDLEIKTIEQNNKKYINSEEKIEVPFEVFKDSERGRYILKLYLEGFYTDKNNNISIKFSKEFELNYKIY